MVVRITGTPNNPRKRTKKGTPIGSPRGPAAEYKRRLFELNRLLKTRTSLISAMVRDGQSVAAVTAALEREIAQANDAFDRASAGITSAWRQQIDAQNKLRIEGMLKRSLGVDTVSILDDDAVRPSLDIATADSTRLIKSIPEQHFAKVTQSIIANYRGETFEEGSLTNRLRAIGGITDKRAKFIARDQTAKFVSSLNEIRQKEAGIDGYRWRNAQDRLVVGAPGGEYQPTRAHGDHYAREGKVFTWDKPPHDGHPGQAPGCRCRAEPVINIDKVVGNADRF